MGFVTIESPDMLMATLQDSLVTALIAAGSTVTAVLLTYWLPERRRRQERNEARRQQAALVTEPVRNLLLDAEDAKTAEQADAVRRRWRDDLRDPFTAFGVSQGSTSIVANVLEARNLINECVNALPSDSPRQRMALAEATDMIRELRVMSVGDQAGTNVFEESGSPLGRIGWTPGATGYTPPWRVRSPRHVRVPDEDRISDEDRFP